MRKEILLSYFPKITCKRYHDLIAIFDNLDNVWQATSDDLIKIGWEKKLVNEFIDWKNKVNEEKIAKILEHENINCLTKDDKNYPVSLKELYDPPFCLFVRGVLPKDGFNLAVVGTRKYTTYGKQVTEEIVSGLVQNGLTIISGLALGIDGIAHETTLQTGGKTIAVLGTGINDTHIYPCSHRNLAKRIINFGGALISEYPPGTLPSRFGFPKRNRIIAGLSLGVFVTEAPEDSGALITAQCALDLGREVFAIPHPITSPTAVGTNTLIKNGAHLINSAKDILEILNLQEIKQFIGNREILPDSPTEATLLKFLSREPTHVDQLIKLTQLDSPTINATLTMMEMKGKVRNLGGMMYVLGK